MILAKSWLIGGNVIHLLSNPEQEFNELERVVKHGSRMPCAIAVITKKKAVKNHTEVYDEQKL